MKDIDFRHDPAAEQEWQAQERREGPYANVARVAAHPMEPELPADFAERVAGVAQARARALRQPARLEAWLVGLMLAVMLGVAVAVGATDISLGQLAAQPWLLGLGACLVLSQGLDWAARRARRTR
jgi:hypothetical protein